MNTSRSVRMRRHSLAAAISLALASTAAHADTFNVTTNADAGAGSFREAIASANGTAGPHTIDFSAISGQTITLESDLPRIEEDLTLQGSDVTLGGDDQYQCLDVEFADLTVNAMTITQCRGSSIGQLVMSEDRGIGYSTPDYAGGGIRSAFGDLVINDSTITGNVSPYAVEDYTSVGGGVAAKYGSVQINNSTISDNSAYAGGGLYTLGAPAMITDSVIDGNSAVKYGGGILAVLPSSYGQEAAERGAPTAVALEGTTISANTAEAGGGAFILGNVAMNASEVSGNEAMGFAGMAAFVPPGSYAPAHTITDSSFLDNYAAYVSGGLLLGGSSTITGTTISGNQAVNEIGGAAILSKYETQDVTIENSTISGNSAGEAGGLMIYGYYYEGTSTAINLTGLTVTGNSGTDSYGGGLMAGADNGPVAFNIANSIIAGNSAAQGSASLTAAVTQVRSDHFGQLWDFLGAERGIVSPSPDETIFNVTYTLLGEAPDSGTFNPDAATSGLIGSDPLLGALADNGGPTMTHLPDTTGPAVDAIPSGTNGCGGSFDVDQRGEARPEGDGCDMGSTEQRGTVPPPPEPQMVPVLDRIGLLVLGFGAGLLGLLGLNRRRQRH